MVIKETVILQLAVGKVGAGVCSMGEVRVPQQRGCCHRGTGMSRGQQTMLRKLGAGGTDGIGNTLTHKFP